MYGLKIFGTDQVSFGSLPVPMVVKIIWSTEYIYMYMKNVGQVCLSQVSLGQLENCDYDQLVYSEVTGGISVLSRTTNFKRLGPTLNNTISECQTSSQTFFQS